MTVYQQAEAIVTELKDAGLDITIEGPFQAGYSWWADITISGRLVINPAGPIGSGGRGAFTVRDAVVWLSALTWVGTETIADIITRQDEKS